VLSPELKRNSEISHYGETILKNNRSKDCNLRLMIKNLKSDKEVRMIDFLQQYSATGTSGGQGKASKTFQV
jgi:hypothetical protein